MEMLTLPIRRSLTYERAQFVPETTGEESQKLAAKTVCEVPTGRELKTRQTYFSRPI
jgi:hypothetical protein